MTIKHLPREVDTVIVGNGPSALILSYILHGHIPFYDRSRPHPDTILHHKLSQSPCLLDANVNDLTAHFGASRLSYSTQALPVNVLLDALLRPLADTHCDEHPPSVKWCFQEEKKKGHIVVGNAAHAGGQWADNPVAASWDIRTLSYAEMLSLPGYTFDEHLRSVHQGRSIPDCHRPTRREVAGYLSAYPKMAGIKDAVFTGVALDGISRSQQGFHIASHEIRCKNLVLASGTFSGLIPARPLLQPLNDLKAQPRISKAPLLVIGSGFTAADIIISAAQDRKIIHIFKWDPEKQPSPLRACHRSAYPEYARIYRQMKIAASKYLGSNVVSPSWSRRSDPLSEIDSNYEGLPNTFITEVQLGNCNTKLQLQRSDGQRIEREISNMEYVIGRRGSLNYLDTELRDELVDPLSRTQLISGRTLRRKAEEDVELAPHIFAIGSLTGDSLIRFAYGSCVMAAKRIFGDAKDLDGSLNS